MSDELKPSSWPGRFLSGCLKIFVGVALLALAPVVGMLGLATIVIGGPSEIATAPLLDAARECIAERTRSEFRPDLDLTASRLGADAVLLGAAALVLLSELGVD